MYNKIVEFSGKIGLPVKKILDIFSYLRNVDKIENFELIRKTGIAKTAINSIKEYFSDIFGEASIFTKIDKSKIEELNNVYNDDYQEDEKLLKFESVAELDEVLVKRVEPNREYDQFTATPETVNNRAGLLKHFADINEKKLVFIGDDDFTSVAVAMSGKAKEIVVLDIDSRILDTINDISKKYSLNINTIKYDLSKALPSQLLSRFDVVFTDPPYTPEGIRLFLSRAISAIDRNNLSGRIYLCYGNSDRAKERFLPIYRSIIDSGLMLRYVFDKFNRYTGAESIGSSSSLFVLDVTPKLKALIKGDYDNPIYTND
jgi:hypothetical protein